MRFCLDTNIFFSFQKGIDLGTSSSEVAQNLILSTQNSEVRYFMPPKIVDELLHLVDPGSTAVVSELLTHVTVQSPTTHNQTVGVQILYEFVDECRRRTQQGLHIADDVVVQTANSYLQKNEMSKVEFQKSLQPIKENLRLRYRNATRTGFVDSLADLDILFLCKETDALLISADEGVVLWGRKLGVKEMNLSVFGETIKKYIK